MLSDLLNFISSAFYDLMIEVIEQLPDIDFAVPQGIWDGLEHIAYGVAYFLPINDLLPILYIDISLSVFHIVWAIILRVKSFIPMMGA